MIRLHPRQVGGTSKGSLLFQFLQRCPELSVMFPVQPLPTYLFYFYGRQKLKKALLPPISSPVPTLVSDRGNWGFGLLLLTFDNSVFRAFSATSCL